MLILYVTLLYITTMMETIGEIIRFILKVLTNSLAENTTDAVIDKVRPDAVKRAYKRALKRWTDDKRLRRMYADLRIDTLGKLAEYIDRGCDMGGEDVEELCRLLYEELNNDEATRQIVVLMNTEASNKRLVSIEHRQDEMLLGQERLHDVVERVADDVEATRGVSHFDKPEGYIPRTCSVVADSSSLVDRFVHPERYRPFSLLELVAGVTVVDGGRCILLAGAQAGKTTELYNLAYELQQDGLLKPLLYEVRDYAELTGLLPKLTDDMQRKTVLLIDALDERFDGNARNNLFNDINGYAKDYPHLRIILSCRSNFKDEIMLDDFVRVSLDDLSMEQVKAFLRDRGAAGLLKYIEKDLLYEFTRVPFFLSALVDFYKEKGTVPTDKNVLYEFVIDRRLSQEEKKSLEYRYDMLHEGRRLLGRLATGMQLIGANAMTDKDIVSMLGCNDHEWGLLQHSGMLELSSDKYRFVHNSFKEYFVAGVMCEMSMIDDIKKMCCYSGTDRIRDTWYNTLALYISRIRSHNAMFDELIKWISSDNMEMVLFIEKRTMSLKMRSDMFIRLMGEYNSKHLRIAEGSDYTYRRLMDFGSSVASAKYLFEELGRVTEINTPAINLLWCAKFIDWELLYDSDELAASLRDVLYGLLGKFLDVANSFFYVMLPFENKEFIDESGLNRIFDIVKDCDSAEVVSGFISLVNMAGMTDRYIDYIISHDACVNNYSYGEIHYHVGRDDLYKAYKSVSDKESLLKVLSQIAVLLRAYHDRHTSDRNDIVGVLGNVLDKLAEGWGADNGVEELVETAMLGCDEHFFRCDSSDAVDMFVAYFRKTGQDATYFEKLYGKLENAILNNDDKYDYDEKSALAYCTARMLSDECVDYVSERFERNTAEGAYMLYYLRDYAQENMRSMIDVKLYNLFPNHVRVNYIEMATKREQAELNVLFDYDEFRRQVIGVMTDRQVKSKTDVRQLRRQNRLFSYEEEERLNRFVLFFFYHVFDDDDKLDLNTVKQAVDDMEKYSAFLLQHGFRYMYSDSKERVVLDDAQRERLARIAVDVLRCLVDGSAVDCEVAACALKMLLYGGLTIEKELALGLMPWADFLIYEKGDGFYSHEYTVLDYIEERDDVSVDDIKCFIYDMIDSDGWPGTFRRREIFARFLCKHGLSGGCSRTFIYVRDWNGDNFEWINMLGIMMEYEQSCCFVLDRVEVLTPLKRLHVWDSGTLFKDGMYRETMLRDVEDNLSGYGTEYIDKALKLLLRLGSVVGIKYLNEHIAESRIRSDNFTFNNTSVEVLPTLMEMYVKVCSENKEFDPFLSSLVDAIANIAVSSEEGYSAVEKVFRDLMEADGKYVYLNFYIERWRKKRLEAGLCVWTVQSVRDFLAVLDRR